MRISDWSSDVCSSDLFGLTPVWAQEMDHSMHQPPQQTESAPESSKPGDPHAGHDTASPQSTQASNEPAQPQQMEHSMHAPAEQDRSVSKPPAEPVDPHAGHDMSEPMEPERTDMRLEERRVGKGWVSTCESW